MHHIFEDAESEAGARYTMLASLSTTLPTSTNIAHHEGRQPAQSKRVICGYQRESSPQKGSSIHLGAALESRPFVRSYVEVKVN